MNQLKFLLLSFRPSAVRPLCFLAVAALCSASLLLRTAQATPITLQFQTTVASTAGFPLALPETALPLPFSIHEDDPLVGSFTFEPASGSNDYSETAVLSFAIDGHQLLASQFQISIADNGFGSIDTRGRLAEPGRTPAVDIASFHADRIFVECQNFGSGYCGAIVTNNDVHFTTQLIFEDSRNLQTLTSNDIPTDPAIWNSFRSRELQIGFNNGAFVGAYITELRQVAEPSTLRLLLALVGTFSAHGLFMRTS